jgi:hypothetical protein
MIMITPEEFDNLAEQIKGAITLESARGIFRMIPGEYPALKEFAWEKWLSLATREGEKASNLKDAKRVYELTPAGTKVRELIGQKCLMLALVI